MTPEEKAEKRRVADRKRYHDNPEPARSRRLAWYHTHPESYRMKRHAEYQNDPEPKRTIEREKYRADPKAARTKTDALLYNLLPGEREKIRDYQNGLDPITGHPLTPLANLDHDHKTGLVRGLLNPMTNKFLVDDEKKLMLMLKYIQNPPAPLALGESVFGLLGLAQRKKKMLYGPDGAPQPTSRMKKE